MSDRALLSLHALARFDVAAAAAIVARLMKARQQAQELVDDLTLRCAASAREIREMMRRDGFNPALLDAVQRLHRAELDALRQWRSNLTEAEEREQQASVELARIRNRERSLHRALQLEERKLRMKQDAREMSAMDDLWLQQSNARGVP